jgi:hypothetical protein
LLEVPSILLCPQVAAYQTVFVNLLGLSVCVLHPENLRINPPSPFLYLVNLLEYKFFLEELGEVAATTSFKDFAISFDDI